MRKTIAAFGTIVLTLAVTAGVAFAGEMSVDPASVDAAGETTLTVSLTDFSPGLAIFVLPCEVPESGDPADIDGDSCDTGQLTPVTVGDDGTAELEVTYEIPDGGIAIAAGDAAQTESAFAIVAFGGGGDDGGDDGAGDDDGGDDEAPTTTAAAEEEPDTPDELPATGLDSYGFAAIGMALLALGLIAVRAERRSQA